MNEISDFARGAIFCGAMLSLVMILLFNLHHITDGIDAIMDRIWVWRHRKDQ